MAGRTSSLTVALRRALSRMSDPRRSAPVIHAGGLTPDAVDQLGQTRPSAKWLAFG